MRLTSTSFIDGDAIPTRLALCAPDPDGHVRFSDNRNPSLEWDGGPGDTKSFALLWIDGDAPSVADDANREGRDISPELPRVDFTHWAIVDIGADVTEIAEGEYSDTVVAGGKEGSRNGPREGVNDYTGWFEGDPDMAGTYKGYDGPCPPWNDLMVHKYVFTIYALDVERLNVEGEFTAADVREAMTGHVLGQASLTGTYTLNPALI